VKRGGIAVWCIHHPVSTVMLTLTAIVLGLFALSRLSIDLLPRLIYPEIGVRVLDPAVPANIMEDQVTRQLEEQLAITEDSSGVTSTTLEGTAEVELYFDYGKDIDVALRDASTRLDRAKRFLPTTIDPPIIFKRDPSQIPVMEFVVTSPLRGMTELRTWTDDVFAKYFLNLPGVAAVEVGGGLVREVHVLPDQRRLAGLGLSVEALVQAIERGNVDSPAGRLRMSGQEYSSRTAGRVQSVEALAALPIRLPNGDSVRLSEVAQVIDTHEDERIRVRYNGTPGVRLSIQKQPTANTVDVAEVVSARLAELRERRLVPEDVRVDVISNQAVYVRQSLDNATLAALAGATLAMLVVYCFLGSVRGTLIIGSAIPISIMITFVIMALGGLSLNLMTLGGLALGIGMLVDNTIVMLENIERHQREGESGLEAAENAAGEVTSPIIAATSTNLAAVLPFLFISGLVGLLFRELIFTITASIIASLMVAVTLVPALAARGKPPAPSRVTRAVQAFVGGAQRLYAPLVRRALFAAHRQAGVPADHGRRPRARVRAHRPGQRARRDGPRGAPAGRPRAQAGRRQGYLGDGRRLDLRAHAARAPQPQHARHPAGAGGRARPGRRALGHGLHAHGRRAAARRREGARAPVGNPGRARVALGRGHQRARAGPRPAGARRGRRPAGRAHARPARPEERAAFRRGAAPGVRRAHRPYARRRARRRRDADRARAARGARRHRGERLHRVRPRL
jgi:multidrug efflux pump subunit AcrB